MPNEGIEKRKTRRFNMTSSIEYVLYPRTSDEVYKGVLVNISTTGLCAYVFSSHPEGQQIAITSRLPVEYSAATIMWTDKEDDGFYRTGWKFSDQSSI